MIRKTPIILILIFFLIDCSAFAVDLNMKPKLAFAPFIAINVEALAFAENLSSLLYNSIDRTGYFEIMERRKIESSIEQEGLKNNNLTQNDLYKIGLRAGLDFLIFGSVKRGENGIIVEIELMGMRTNKKYYSETFTTADYEITDRLKKVTTDLLARANGSLLEEKNTKPDDNIVKTPTGLEITGSSTKVHLKWKSLEGANIVGYKLFRASSDNGPFVHLTTIIEPDYTDSDLKVNQTYFYRIKAVNSRGVESEFSITAIGKTSIAPQPPIFLNIIPEIKGSRLFWRPRPSDGSDPKLFVTGFKIYRKITNDKTYLEITRCTKEQTSFQDKGLINNVSYTYVITSLNSDDTESEFSAILAISPLPE
jgi:uncharacterized protein